MCNESVQKNALLLVYVPNRFKTQEMCNEAVRSKLCMVLFVPDHFWTQEICNEIMRTMPDAFHRIPYSFKTQKMCDHAVIYDPSSLIFVPDWFVTKDWLYMWHDDYYDNDGSKDKFTADDEGEFFTWYDGYRAQRAQKASIKEELLPIAWHPTRYWDWCVSEDEKMDIEKLWA